MSGPPKSWHTDPKQYRQSPRPSLRVFTLQELNAAEGAVWFRDYPYLASCSWTTYKWFQLPSYNQLEESGQTQIVLAVGFVLLLFPSLSLDYATDNREVGGIGNAYTCMQWMLDKVT